LAAGLINDVGLGWEFHQFGLRSRGRESLLAIIVIGADEDHDIFDALVLRVNLQNALDELPIFLAGGFIDGDVLNSGFKLFGHDDLALDRDPFGLRVLGHRRGCDAGEAREEGAQ
jgi:hypothetical protein